jgi:hypothetical protein
MFFFSPEHNPRNYPEHWFSETSYELLNLARESVKLRKLLVLPTERCIGRLFEAACTENADFSNPHRLGPLRLAARLLSEIEDLQSSTPSVP